MSGAEKKQSGQSQVTDEQRDAFLSRTAQVAEVVRSHIKAGSLIKVISHNDADGLASGGIIGTALAREGVRFHVHIVEELTDEVMDVVTSGAPDLYIFSDIGSGYMPLLLSHHAEPAVILDHHPPSAPPSENMHQLNPHDFGIAGATQISGAGICYLLAKQLSEKNVDLCTVAIVGALGDMQDKNENRALSGLNELVVADGIASGLLKAGSDILVYGRESRPIHRALAFTTTPHLPTLTGHEDNCLTLLTTNGIQVKDGERFRTAANLSLEEKQKILSAIMSYMASMSLASSQVLDMIGTAYTLTAESPDNPTRDAREFSSLLNACGRTGSPSLGLSICMGDRKSALEEAGEIVTNYRRAIATSLDWVLKTPEVLQKFSTLWAVMGGTTIPESMTGAISSILMTGGSLTSDHVLIVLAEAKEGGFKMSARAPEKLLKIGVNLGAALSEVAPKHSGFGGGHNVAAGAYVKVEDPTTFLKDVDDALASQIANAQPAK